jgi:hypothetical protein
MSSRMTALFCPHVRAFCTLIIPCLIVAGAYVDNGIDHILDGYSYALITRVSGDQSTTHVNVLLRAVSDDQKDLADEKNGLKKFGLFTGRLSWFVFVTWSLWFHVVKCRWRKLFCGGRAFQLITTGRAVDRRTAHQPIFFPAQNHAYFASAFTYPAFSVNWQPVCCCCCFVFSRQFFFSGQDWLAGGGRNSWESDHLVGEILLKSFSFVLKPATCRSAFPKNDYVCMHPLFEASSGRVLTYTFLHSKIGRKTAVR